MMRRGTRRAEAREDEGGEGEKEETVQWEKCQWIEEEEEEEVQWEEVQGYTEKRT